MNIPKLTLRDLPKPPHWSKAIGVGIVVMGLAIGTGELIMWPHLVTKHGLDLLWLAFLGISAQFFINYEVARHSTATGESFFTSSSRVIKYISFFWLFAAILLYIWPAWASVIGTTLLALFGVGSHLLWSWVVLGLVLVLTFSGKVAYSMLEGMLKIIVPVFFILLVIISFYNLDSGVLLEAWKGLTNFGHIPLGVDMNVLLGAVVFAGAGGMLNLAVSLWYRDKGVGMGAFVGKITNPITGKSEATPTTGHTFKPTTENMKRWRGWMRYVLVDQGLVFWLVGLITLLLLAVNAYAVLGPLGLVPEGMDVAVVQANILGQMWGPIGYNLFLVMAALMLFSVMWTVIDALTRMISDIIYTNAHMKKPLGFWKPFKGISIGKLYYGAITIIVLVGSVLITVDQPLTLLVISGVLSGLSMALYTPLLIYMNNVKLPKEIRPKWYINVPMVLISIFFIYFAIQVIIEKFFST